MELIQQFFPDLTQEQLSQLDQAETLYRTWNEKVNLISRKDIENLYERHILHSLSIGLFFHFKANTHILDVGTGGGFPGIPLAILFPECSFLLLDSIGKKITVVKDIAEKLQLTNVKTSHLNVKNYDAQYDFIVSRAVTSFPEFYRLVKKNIAKKQHNQVKNGIIYLKGGDIHDEIHDFPRMQVFPLDTKIKLPFFETKKILYLPK